MKTESAANIFDNTANETSEDFVTNRLKKISNALNNFKRKLSTLDVSPHERLLLSHMLERLEQDLQAVKSGKVTYLTYNSTYSVDNGDYVNNVLQQLSPRTKDKIIEILNSNDTYAMELSLYGNRLYPTLRSKRNDSPNNDDTASSVYIINGLNYYGRITDERNHIEHLIAIGVIKEKLTPEEITRRARQKVARALAQAEYEMAIEAFIRNDEAKNRG